MSRIYVLLTCLLIVSHLSGQTLYFPPADGAWETQSPTSLGWCAEKLDSLQTYLGERGTKAFIILKDGRMVVEWYYDDFTPNSPWYWASAGKSLTATLIGIAQQEGFLDIDDPTSDYLGEGWTSCTPEQEAAITIRHQLTMTTGLDDTTGDVDCTDPDCLQYLAEPGTRWAYHNAPYTLLQEVIHAATGLTASQFFQQYIGNQIGATGLYINLDYNRIFFSNARNMARFGLMILAQGSWDGQAVLDDPAYFQAMTTSSQELNPSYGYLWWLNGQGAHMLPGLQFVFQQDLIPTAPDDLFAALGKNDQKCYVVPSQNLVVIRLGDAASPVVPALSGFDGELWAQISDLACTTTSVDDTGYPQPLLDVFPNPAHDWLHLRTKEPPASWELFSLTGQRIASGSSQPIDTSRCPAGLYLLRVQWADGLERIQRVAIQ
ncbi:MAG: serine hydrolase [Lewinella sp.]|nr:serine hydrolase [Lewinella sp.]